MSIHCSLLGLIFKRQQQLRIHSDPLLMKHLFFSLAMLGAFVASAQTDCGYQPDVEPDGAIGVSDVLAILGLFGAVDSDLDGGEKKGEEVKKHLQRREVQNVNERFHVVA